MKEISMYHPLSKIFHWLMALMIVGLLAMGLVFEYMPQELRSMLMGWHKAFGVLVLALTFVRAMWWLTQTKPALVKTLPAWVSPYINFGHSVLYGFMAVIPFSGWVMSNAAGYPVTAFGYMLPTLVEKNMELRHMMGEIHEIGAYVLIAVLVSHVAAAVYHHRIFKDETLTRMMFGK